MSDLTTPIPSELIGTFSRKNTARWLLNVATDWGIIIGTFLAAAFFDTWFGYLVALLVIGTRQHALGVLGHDGAHWLIARNRFLNDWLAILFCYWPFFGSLDGFREYHYKHHRYLGTPQDPELQDKYWSAPTWDLPISSGRILSHIFLDLSGLGILFYKRRVFWHMMRNRQRRGALHSLDMFLSFWKKGSRTRSFGLVLFWCGVLSVFWAYNILWVVALWVVAMVTSFLMSFKMRVLTEHLGTLGTHRFSYPLWYAFFFLPRNIGFHYEHHRYPSIPLWNLPKLRVVLDPQVPVQTVWNLFRWYRHSGFIPSGKPVATASFPGTIQEHVAEV